MTAVLKPASSLGCQLYLKASISVFIDTNIYMSISQCWLSWVSSSYMCHFISTGQLGFLLGWTKPTVAIPYSNDDLTTALEFTRAERQRPKLTPDGLPYHNLEDYIKCDLRYRDPLKWPSTWADDDPSGDFELYNDSRRPRPESPGAHQSANPVDRLLHRNRQ
ncbi:hypothetical protein ACJ73_02852 [Blastomyces percursus]|uniref:Uncharacterized protein n=1 Tax=Blastomyces percursus TaxID=1658174 RepID=A0A1J9QAC2_9EURO|nr:hypothetical protein ACJ73_02852 [Blastomyces percursus]